LVSSDAPDAYRIGAVGRVTIEDTKITGGFEDGLTGLGGLSGRAVSARPLRIESVGKDLIEHSGEVGHPGEAGLVAGREDDVVYVGQLAR
jgi:hypothetical protein